MYDEKYETTIEYIVTPKAPEKLRHSISVTIYYNLKYPNSNINLAYPFIDDKGILLMKCLPPKTNTYTCLNIACAIQYSNDTTSEYDYTGYIDQNYNMNIVKIVPVKWKPYYITHLDIYLNDCD